MLRRVIAILVLAGGMLCTGSSALASAPTKARYIAQADAICRAESKLLEPYAKKYSRLTDGHTVDYSGAAITLSEADAVRSASLVKLRALRPPAGARSKLVDIWGTFGRLITETQQIAVALRGGDVSSATYLDADAELTGGRYELLSEAFGFKVCGAQRG
jgi:hypothetical protein